MKTHALWLAAFAAAATFSAQAQKHPQTTVNGTVSSIDAPAASNAAEGLKRKGSGEQSSKMKSGVSRNGNTNLSPTSPFNTQGSTSVGNASSPSPGGATGTNTREARRPQPKSRAAQMNAGGRTSATGTGEANSPASGPKTNTSSGTSRTSITERGQREGSYTDAAKRGTTATSGRSGQPLRSGPNGQQTNSGYNSTPKSDGNGRSKNENYPSSQRGDTQQSKNNNAKSNNSSQAGKSASTAPNKAVGNN